MQVAHGETLFLGDHYESYSVYEQRFSSNQAEDSSCAIATLSEDNKENFTSQSRFEDCDSDVVEVVCSQLLVESWDCVGNLKLRAELLRVSSFLQRMVPDRVIVHNDSVASRVQRRLEDGLESRAFVAFDVERLIDQWGFLRAQLPEVRLTVRAGAANRHILAALVDVLEVGVNVDSAVDIDILRECIRDITEVYACSPHTCASQSQVSEASGVDVCTVRSPSRIKASLTAGIRLFCVGSLSGIRSISAACKVLRCPHPELVLAVRRRRQGLGSMLAGSSVEKSRVLSFDVSGVSSALAEADALGIKVVGVSSDVASLLDGTVRAALITMASLKQKNVQFTVAIEEVGCVDVTINSLVRAAIATLEEVCPTVTVQLDVTAHLLGANQSLLSRVIGARPSVGDNGEIVGRQFYIDDGIYGSLCRRGEESAGAAFSVGYMNDLPLPYMSDRARDNNVVFAQSEEVDFNALPCTIWGQTCDSLDKVMVTGAGQMPVSLSLGDWLSFAVPMCSGNMTNTGFNGYDAPVTRFMVHTGFE